VNELTRCLIVEATRSKRFCPRAVRIDSTVIEADVKYPTDANLAADGVAVLAREGRKLARLIGERKLRVRDRSRSMGRKLRAVTRTIRRRSGQAKAEVLALTEQTGQLLARSVTEARELAAVARRRARGRGAKVKLRGRPIGAVRGSLREVSRQNRSTGCGRADHRPDRVAGRSRRPADPQRQAGQAKRIWVRRAVRADHRAHPQGCAWSDPSRVTRLGNPGEDTLLPNTVSELKRLGISVKEVALDGGFNTGPTRDVFEHLKPERVFISGRQQPGSKRTQRRLQRYRTGAEGRISHRKRGYGLGRSRLKGDEGQQIWTGWAVLAYNADTLAIRTR